MPLFDIIKDPASAESAVTLLITREENPVEDEQVAPSEVELLRAAARDTDARDAVEPEYPMDALAESFLAKCLAHARETSQRPYRHDADLEEGFRGSLRVVGVPLLTGDWPTVLKGRESALATIAELARQDYAHPCHDFRRVNGQWELRIRFSF